MAIIALHSAASGMSALSTQLDVISNNIANANNNGFKTSRVNFEDLLYQYRETPGQQNLNSDISPVGIGVGYGTRVSGTELNMAQGSTVTTGGQLDLAIQGGGFFKIKTLTTQGDGTAYTRTGSFSMNATGQMVMADDKGYLIDPPIQFPANTQSVTISNDGQVWATVAGSSTPTQSGQIQLSNFPNPQGLLQIGSNLYQQTQASGPPTAANPGANNLGTLQQGAVEASNTDPVTELVNMIKTQRTFELNSQSIQAADQMLQQVNQLRR